MQNVQEKNSYSFQFLTKEHGFIKNFLFINLKKMMPCICFWDSEMKSFFYFSLYFHGFFFFFSFISVNIFNQFILQPWWQTAESMNNEFGSNKTQSYNRYLMDFTFQRQSYDWAIKAFKINKIPWCKLQVQVWLEIILFLFFSFH